MSSVPSVLSGLVPDAASVTGMILVFLVLCAVAGALLTVFGPRETLLGMIRLGISYLTAPFVFLWKSAGEVARYGRDGDRDLRKSDQYLLGHVYLYMLGAGVVAAILWTAGTITFVVFSLLPPAGSGKALSEARTAEQAAQAGLDGAERELQEQKTAGPQRLAAEFERKKAEATRSLRASEAAVATARQRIAAQGGLNVDAVDRLGTELDEKAGWSGEVESIRSEMVASFSSNPNLNESDREALGRWLDAWAARTRARAALAVVTETPVAEQAAKLVAEAEEKTSAAKSDLEAARQDVASREAARKPRWGLASTGLVTGLVVLVLAAWLFGLLAESWALLLRLAGDVRETRDLLSRIAPMTVASEIGKPPPRHNPERPSDSSPLGLASPE